MIEHKDGAIRPFLFFAPRKEIPPKTAIFRLKSLKSCEIRQKTFRVTKNTPSRTRARNSVLTIMVF